MYCGNCDNYSTNKTGCWVKSICLADMLDTRAKVWNVKLDADHKCHRSESFKKKER